MTVNFSFSPQLLHVDNKLDKFIRVQPLSNCHCWHFSHRCCPRRNDCQSGLNVNLDDELLVTGSSYESIERCSTLSRSPTVNFWEMLEQSFWTVNASLLPNQHGQSNKGTHQKVIS